MREKIEIQRSRRYSFQSLEFRVGKMKDKEGTCWKAMPENQKKNKIQVKLNQKEILEKLKKNKQKKRRQDNKF